MTEPCLMTDCSNPIAFPIGSTEAAIAALGSSYGHFRQVRQVVPQSAQSIHHHCLLLGFLNLTAFIVMGRNCVAY